MVDAKGHVHVADFGLAKSTGSETSLLTVSRMSMGTPDFMAPESHLGMDQVDHRADLYAVGVMLYQMLTGKLPRGRFDPPSRAVPGLDKRLDAIIDRTLQNDREARYASALELRTALDPVLRRTMAKRVAATSKSAASRQKPLLIATGALAVIAVVVGAFFFAKNPRSQPASSASEGESEARKLAGVDAVAAPGGVPAPPPAAATKDAPFVNTLGMKFVPVPIIGGPTDGQRVLFSIWETRVQDYEVFMREAARQWQLAGFEQGPTHPAVRVHWQDAQDFCAWLTARERQAGRLPATARYRLPSDHEWRCAAGLGGAEAAEGLPMEKHGKTTDLYSRAGPRPACRPISAGRKPPPRCA